LWQSIPQRVKKKYRPTHPFSLLFHFVNLCWTLHSLYGLCKVQWWWYGMTTQDGNARATLSSFSGPSYMVKRGKKPSCVKCCDYVVSQKPFSLSWCPSWEKMVQKLLYSRNLGLVKRDLNFAPSPCLSISRHSTPSFDPYSPYAKGSLLYLCHLFCSSLASLCFYVISYYSLSIIETYFTNLLCLAIQKKRWNGRCCIFHAKLFLFTFGDKSLWWRFFFHGKKRY